MTDGRWRMADGRCRMAGGEVTTSGTLLWHFSFAIRHLPSAICYLPFAFTICHPWPGEPRARFSAAVSHDKPGEPGHRDVLAGARVDRQDHIAHGLRLVLDELLIEQDALGEPGVDLALGDLLLDVRRLAGNLAHEDALLLGDGLFGNVLPFH